MPALYLTQDLGHRVKWHAATVTGSLRSHSDAHARARPHARPHSGMRGEEGSGVQQEQICPCTDFMRQTVIDTSSSSVSADCCTRARGRPAGRLSLSSFGLEQTRDGKSLLLSRSRIILSLTLVNTPSGLQGSKTSDLQVLLVLFVCLFKVVKSGSSDCGERRN